VRLKINATLNLGQDPFARGLVAGDYDRRRGVTSGADPDAERTARNFAYTAARAHAD
jgi:hypothetical protein